MHVKDTHRALDRDRYRGVAGTGHTATFTRRQLERKRHYVSSHGQDFLRNMHKVRTWTFTVVWHRSVLLISFRCISLTPLVSGVLYTFDTIAYPDSKVHGANMGPTWVLSVPDGPHVGPVNLAIRVVPLKQPWRIWVNKTNRVRATITTTKQSKAHQCAYFMGHCKHATKGQYCCPWDHQGEFNACCFGKLITASQSVCALTSKWWPEGQLESGTDDVGAFCVDQFWVNTSFDRPIMACLLRDNRTVLGTLHMNLKALWPALGLSGKASAWSAVPPWTHWENLSSRASMENKMAQAP